MNHLKIKNLKKSFYIFTILASTLLVINACKHEIPEAIISTSPTPVPGAAGEVCFESQILPIFQSNCAKSGCHDAASHQDDFVFDNYANIIKKDIRPGNAANSKVYKVLFETGTSKMPPSPNADLTTEQKALIGKWINEGAKNTVSCTINCDSSQFKYGANITTILSAYCLGCHSGAGPSGGIDLSTYNNVKTVALSGRLVGAVSHAPGYSAMPKNASKLSACQIAQIRKWVDAGSPNN
jgi:hypothetical protein